MKFKKLLSKLPQRFQFTIHNLIGHPLMEIMWLLGFNNVSVIIHDVTQPFEEQTIDDD